MKPYQLALIPCTARKNRQARTAITLYHGGPFSLMVRHAQMNASALLIMSAKYGLLQPHDPVQYYDLYLPNLEPLEREGLVEHISRQVSEKGLMLATKIVSYLPEAYYSVLSEASPPLAARMDRPFKGIRMLTAWKMMSEDLKNARASLFPGDRKGLWDV